MIKDQTSREYGTTIFFWIEHIHEELTYDAVGLWQIIPRGRNDYGLDRDDEIECTRLCLKQLARNGAYPVKGERGRTDVDWVFRDYGPDREVWIEAVIAEWLASGKDPGPGEPWFADPRYVSVGEPSR